MNIHYFQRYHTKENVDTANAMLFLSRLYSHSSVKFYKFLSRLLPENASVELTVKLQTKSENSVPDALIRQESFRIAIETKRFDQFSFEQLKNHIGSFGKETYRVLLTLSPGEISDSVKKALDTYLDEINRIEEAPIIHKHITFESLINDVREVIDERDYEMLDIWQDYSLYCYESGLIPDAWKRLKVRCAGDTLADNKKYNLYYDGADTAQGIFGFDYIGLYNDKSVRVVGKIESIILATYENEHLKFEPQKKYKMTPAYEKRISDALESSKAIYGNSLVVRPHYYFLVEKFYETDFKKSTKNPLFGQRVFDLMEWINGFTKETTAERIAEMLRQVTWG